MKNNNNKKIKYKEPTFDYNIKTGLSFSLGGYKN